VIPTHPNMNDLIPLQSIKLNREPDLTYQPAVNLVEMNSKFKYCDIPLSLYVMSRV